MYEVIFLWFGIVSIIFGEDLLTRGKDIGIVPIILGAAGIIFYIVSVFITLP